MQFLGHIVLIIDIIIIIPSGAVEKPELISRYVKHGFPRNLRRHKNTI